MSPPNMTIGSVSGVRTPRTTTVCTTLPSPTKMAPRTTQLFAVEAARGFPDARSIVIAAMANAIIAPVIQRTELRHPGPIRLPTNTVIGMLIE
jgi:methionine synthase II (cobalamin-independent)